MTLSFEQSLSLNLCRSIASAAVLACALVACSDKPAEPDATRPSVSTNTSTGSGSSNATAPRAPGASSARKSASSSSDEEQKIQLYVTCFNKVNANGQEAIARYTGWVKNMKTGPTGRETSVGSVRTILQSDVKSCNETLPTAKAMEPALAQLDGQADAYLKAVTELAESLQKAYSYYDQKDYKDDKFAKAKAMHPELAARMAAFERASNKLSQTLDEENARVQDLRLARMEKEDGRKMPYLQLAIMQKARILADTLQKESFSADVAAQQIQALDSLLQETATYTSQNHSDVPRMWSPVQRAGEEYLKVSKERMRRIRDKTPYSSSDKVMADAGAHELIRGSSAQVIRAYNSLVSYSNGLR